MGRSFELHSDAVLNSPELGLLPPKYFVAWLYAVASAAERNSDVPNWKALCKPLRVRRPALDKIICGLIEADLVSHEPPHALLKRGEFWRIPHDRPWASEWMVIRARIFKRDDYTCRYCSARGVRLECDHVVPVSKGGTHEDGNLVTACFGCNRSKRDKTLAEWLPSRAVTQGHTQ